jgi:hypothetical protein
VHTNQAVIPEFDRFWQEGRIPQRAEEYVLFADFRADQERHRRATPSGPIELFIPNSSQDSAMMIVRRNQLGSNRTNGWARHRQRFIRSISS